MSGPRDQPDLPEFLGDHPTRRLDDWASLWERDLAFPIATHRGWLGRLGVSIKRLLRPLVKGPQQDLWDRQRSFNLILLEYLHGPLEARLDELAHRQTHLEERIAHLEAFMKDGLQEVMQHNDALFSRVDQKLDRYRAESRDLSARLGAALARVEADDSVLPLRRAREEAGYLDFEGRFRGSEEDIGERFEAYLPRLAGRQPILDLGCGRGESLQRLALAGLEARGVDASAEMVARCRSLGLDVVEGDLLEALTAQPPASLGAVVSFHVIEHLTPAAIERLVRLAYAALRPGGLLLLETPNPLSLMTARDFWLDPTHVRPVHPEYLQNVFAAAGFEDVECLRLRPFGEADRLPEIELEPLPVATREVADRVNRLRDRLDDVLFGCQDFAVLGCRPELSG